MQLNSRVVEIQPSSTLAITARAKELRAQGADVVNFAAGEPDFDTPDSIKKAAIEAINKGLTKYTPSVGTVELRKAIAEKFLRDNGLTYTPDQIAVNCGAKHSVFAAVQVLADQGDEVIIPSPYWVSYPEMVKFSGATPVIVETTAETEFKLTPEIFLSAITDKTKVLILNSPSNPTGMLYTKEELKAIADICCEKDITVISDEIYEKLVYDGGKFVSFASLGEDVYNRTITINGVSKAYAMTGWRIGYMAGPKEIMVYVKRLQDHSTSNPTSISQAAALAALGMPEENITAMRDEFSRRRDILMEELDGIPEVSYIRPQGAFYLFCDVAKLGNSFDVAQSILNDANVAMIPGEGFGAPGFVRISFATSEERIKEGVKRIKDWIAKNIKA